MLVYTTTTSFSTGINIMTELTQQAPYPSQKHQYCIWKVEASIPGSPWASRHASWPWGRGLRARPYAATPIPRACSKQVHKHRIRISSSKNPQTPPKMSTIPPKTQPKKQRTAAPKKCNRDLTFNEATRLALSSALSSASEPPQINQQPHPQQH